MKGIAPSILSADFSILGKEIQNVSAAGADLIHVDVMDGHFVPNITMGPLVVSAVKKVTSLPIDVHLMILNPDRYIQDFAAAGADYISVHVEACPHLHRVIHAIKDLNIKAGAVLNPATPLSTLDYVLEDLDFVLIMSVNPGFGGQQFIPSSIDKIKALKASIIQKNLKTRIQVDGGVSPETIKDLKKAGADAFVAGSAIFKGSDYRLTIDALKQQMGVSAQ